MGDSALGIVEIIPKSGVYDYKSKYTRSAKTKHIIPVQLSKKNTII